MRLYEDLGFPISAAVCKQENAPTYLFFPPKGDEGAYTKVAKTYCVRCPVRRACGWYAAKHNEIGIWGGETDKQRRGTRKREGLQSQRAPRPTPECTGTASCGRRGCKNFGCVEKFEAYRRDRREKARERYHAEKAS
jgi:hypothetical protein